MDHFTREPAGSIIDRMMALRPVRPEIAGAFEARALVLGASGDVVGAVEHVWVPDEIETERDFVTMTQAAARELGARTLRFHGALPV